MATFNETRAPISRKYATQKGIVMPNLLSKLQFPLLRSSTFPLEKQPKNLSFAFE